MKKILILLFLTTTIVFSQLTSVFNLQGVLRLPTGKAAADKSYNFTFKMYTVAEGGEPLSWVETQSIEVKNGIYNTLIGSRTPFSGLAFDRLYYIGISVDGGSEMVPRVQLTAAPYALSLQGTNNRVPNSGAMQFDTEVWHKSADTPTPNNRIKFVNNGETIINSKVKDKDGFIQPTGAIIAFGGSVAPAGWFICDGSEKSQTEYSELYAVLGDNYKNTWDNASSAVTAGKFRIPNLKGRTPIGTGTTNTAFNQITGVYNQPFSVGLGASQGTNNFRLEIVNMPSHNHGLSYTNYGSGGNTNGYRTNDYFGLGQGGGQGGSLAHDNMPPYLGINYIIKY